MVDTHGWSSRLEMGAWEPLLPWDMFSMQFVNQLVAGSSNKI